MHSWTNTFLALQLSFYLRGEFILCNVRRVCVVVEAVFLFCCSAGFQNSYNITNVSHLLLIFAFAQHEHFTSSAHIGNLAFNWKLIAHLEVNGFKILLLQ